jgi:hypothetical protein
MPGDMSGNVYMSPSTPHDVLSFAEKGDLRSIIATVSGPSTFGP